jgi:hypothetical protein
MQYTLFLSSRTQTYLKAATGFMGPNTGKIQTGHMRGS